MHEWEKRMADNELHQEKLKNLKELLQECLVMAEQYRTKPYPNHNCSDPNSCCDTNCQDAAYDSKFIQRIRFAIKDCENA